ncbi:hypothetical protein AX777_17165 [Sphingobium yanoikuyae]|jgi:hypothetical protein|nr:hypothetical protein [Sphingobium yanoikuyae]MDG2514883.1 hypothetical protein [Sphingobium yanoikuyae]OAH46721.1 hypothetical protein AX777_17165 [Sphingobium yanoikuyae]RSU57278.1 hypothetical protein DAH51_10770 [Sphingobium yanoikuyae]RSU72495.1 hypothetical protein BRX37_18310 [Sphingomonas sp. S-NIH.Pt3_0716]
MSRFRHHGARYALMGQDQHERIKMPHHKERPARKATSRLALYLVFAFIVAAILAFIWVNMHA